MRNMSLLVKPTYQAIAAWAPRDQNNLPEDIRPANSVPSFWNSLYTHNALSPERKKDAINLFFLQPITMACSCYLPRTHKTTRFHWALIRQLPFKCRSLNWFPLGQYDRRILKWHVYFCHSIAPLSTTQRVEERQRGLEGISNSLPSMNYKWGQPLEHYKHLSV